jgi:hypothetical protein
MLSAFSARLVPACQSLSGGLLALLNPKLRGRTVAGAPRGWEDGAGITSEATFVSLLNRTPGTECAVTPFLCGGHSREDSPDGRSKVISLNVRLTRHVRSVERHEDGL